MTNKRNIRQLALQILFIWDANAQAESDMAAQLAADFTEDPVVRQLGQDMARGAWENREVSDRWVEKIAPQWPIHRQPQVDRNLLRMSIWELTHTLTPPKVVIDEAIELAREYSTEQSTAFVNGVLDAALKEITAGNAAASSQTPA